MVCRKRSVSPRYWREVKKTSLFLSKNSTSSDLSDSVIFELETLNFIPVFLKLFDLALSGEAELLLALAFKFTLLVASSSSLWIFLISTSPTKATTL